MKIGDCNAVVRKGIPVNGMVHRKNVGAGPHIVKMRTCLSLILAPNRLFIDLLQMTSLVYSIPVKLAIDLACLDYF